MQAHDKNGELATEKTDAKAGAVMRALVYLLLATSAVAVGLVYLTHDLASLEVRSDPPPAPLAEPAGRVPPEPRLQTRPFEDIASQRAEEGRVLTSYGWVDQKAGVVRIPIEEAMRIVAERGVPPAEPVPPAPASPAGVKK